MKLKKVLVGFVFMFLCFIGIDNVDAVSKVVHAVDCSSKFKYDTTLWEKYAVVSNANLSPPYDVWIEYTTTGTDTNLYCIEPGRILYYDLNRDYEKWATTEEDYVGKSRYVNVARAIQYSGNPLVKSCSSSNIYNRIATGMLVQMISANKVNSSNTNYWRILTKSDVEKLVISDYDDKVAEKFVEIRDKVKYHSKMPFVDSYDYAALDKDEAKKKTTKYFSISGNNFTKTLSSFLFDIDYGWSVADKDAGISSAEIKNGAITITAPIDSTTLGKTMCVKIKKPIANGTLYATSVDDQDTAFYTKGSAKYKYSYICLKTSSAKVKKVDATDTSKVLSGAKFKLYTNSTCSTVASNANGTVFGTSTTGSDGYAYFYNLKNGTYYVKETAALDGYLLNSGCHKVSVSSGSGTVTVKNDPIQIKVKKVDSTNTSKVLSGAKFGLYTDSNCSTVATDANGDKFTSQTTNSSGYAYFDYVKKNTTYYVGEVTAPSGYVKDNSWCQKVDVSSGSVTKTFKNIPVQIKVKKVDSANKSKALSGATFMLYTRSTCASVSRAKNSSGIYYGSVTTGSTGYAYFNKVQLSNVYKDADGNYKFYIKETKSPSGYVIDNNKCTLVTVDAKTGIGSIEFSDTKISSTSVQVHKVDSYDGDPLKGVKITLYDDKCVTPSKRVATPTKETGNNGSVMWNDIDMTGLTSLKLYVMEDKSSIPSGYIQQKENDCKEVVVTSSDIVDGSVDTGSVKNSTVIYNVPFGDIQLLKLDSSTEKPIKGVVFRLLDKDKKEVLDKDGNKVLDVTTNDEGIAKFYNILYGIYYIQEIKTDPNYKTITDLIEFELNENTDSINLDTYSDLIYYVGDVNTDGVVDTLDYSELSTMIKNGEVLGLSKAKQYSSDINADGVIDEIDLRVLDLYVNKKADVEKYEASLKILCGNATSCTLSSSFLQKVNYVSSLDNTSSSNVCYSSVVNPSEIVDTENNTGSDTENTSNTGTDSGEDPGSNPNGSVPPVVNPNTAVSSSCKFTNDSVTALEAAIKASKTDSYVADFNDDKVINESDVNILKAYLNYRDNNKITAVKDYVAAYESIGDLDSTTVTVMGTLGTKITIASDSLLLHSSLVITNTLIDMKISKLDITSQNELPGAEIVIKDSEGNEFIKFISTDEVKQFNIPVGVYTLTETVAPKGYDRITTDVKFEVLPDGNIKLLDVKSDSFKLVKSEDVIDTDSDHLIIYNSLTEVDIPDTGSVISFVSILLGIGFVGYGGYIFYNKYRKRLALCQMMGISKNLNDK